MVNDDILWTPVPPEQLGVNPEPLRRMEQAMRENNHRSCLILKNGANIFEYCRDAEAQASLHKINSCTKSVLSALIGIAVEQGLIPGVHVPVAEYFPILYEAKDRRKRLITIDHLLTMTAGFRWTEYRKRVAYPAMIRSPDWVSYTLKQPLMADPGAGMVYNSGCSHLLAAILQQAAKMDVAVFARTRLFEPLGITAFQWERDPQGMPIGGFGLYLTPRDMARFGQLYLQRGMWAGRRLISGEWVDRTTYPLHRTYEIGFYGRHWWVSSFHANRSEDDAEEWYYFALGFGGQYITVLPSRQTVVVLCNDRHKRDREYVDYLRHFIIPALCGT